MNRKSREVPDGPRGNSQAESIMEGQAMPHLKALMRKTAPMMIIIVIIITTTIIIPPVVIGATRIVRKSLQKHLETIPRQHSIDYLQKNCHTRNITHHKESATS
jgi:hypothetical protein